MPTGSTVEAFISIDKSSAYNFFHLSKFVYSSYVHVISRILECGRKYKTKMKISLILGIIASFSLALAEQETLVLVDNLNIRETHSQFFKSLQGK